MRTKKITAEIWRKKIGNLEEQEKGSLWSVECGPWKSLESQSVRDKTQERKGENKK
jgi:hypothetical protein